MTLWFVRKGTRVFVADDDSDIEPDAWVRELTMNERAQYASGAAFVVSDFPDVTLYKQKQDARIHRVFENSMDHDVGTITREEYHAR